MRKQVGIILFGLILSGCAHDARTSPFEQKVDSGANVGATAQFLSTCDQSCPEPLTCECGVCTASCANDEACASYSGSATCVLPPAVGECESLQRACDVSCEHDGNCEPLGEDFVCIIGRCRHEPKDASVEDAGLIACEPRIPVAGLCVLKLEGPAEFHNDNPRLEATIMALGETEERPDCFGSDNFGNAIPVAAHAGEYPEIAEGTSWWRIVSGESSSSASPRPASTRSASPAVTRS